MPIEKTYDPATTEAKLYERWEQSGAFACDVGSKKKPFCIMMPPPNVTGSLHMGHALTFTLQDVLIRYQRMKGKDVLWQPGTDHAGIATQMVVERQLAAQGGNMDRRAMGREAFLKKVWEWKEESGGTITKQLRRLGASCDWSREKFTMEPALNRGVNHEFVTLYREGLIFRDKRLVNWDPKMLTAVSDLEVEQKEVKGHMWHFRYPLENDPTQYVVVATTRPETMLGDGAVAVNPKDERYQHLIGKLVRLPLTDRVLPIIADEHADPEKGSGAVKITAAHDFNDFEVWKRHRHQDYFKSQKDGGLINLFDAHACLNDNAPEAYRGLDRYEARKRVLADLEQLGLIDKIEKITHAVPHGDRSGVVIEPWLSEQWYCNVKPLAEVAVKAVEDGRTKFVPEQWENTYFAWLRNIEPWCISRQLWWGHQIPAWYGPDGKIFVAETEDEARAEAAKSYGKEVALTRDEDVLDTWFSSALWPFSTLGWPDKTEHLARYYPTDVLVTGFDIIFFWVARMMMMGIHLAGDVPFRKVYIHALVRDEKGQKMSKTKGNVIDPLDVIAQFGCDALRFTLANMSTPGRDIRLATSRIEGNRNFATKIWNAARYCQMNGCEYRAEFDPAAVKQTVNKWIVGETKLAADKIAGLLDSYRFDLSSAAAYEFVWSSFCDWYLEFTKPILAGGDEAAKAETRATTAWAFVQMLHMLHPFMPYITEELWEQFAGGKTLLIKAAWPALPDAVVAQDAQAEMGWVIRMISSIRTIRAELNVPAAAKIPLLIKGAAAASREKLARHEDVVMRLARLSGVAFGEEAPKGSAHAVLDEATLILPLADVIDLEQERARLAKESEKLAADVRKIEAKLGNQDFVSRAPAEVVDEHRARKADAEAAIARFEAARRSLAG
ncbi:MAG: valine--tRNA ligase [Bdellovibrionales bacterium]